MMTIILALIGFALLRISEGAVVQAILFQNEQVSMLTAEAAYENAIYWMSQNPDLLLDMDMSGTDGTLEFPNSNADYHVKFYDFVGYRPVFEVTADGYCGTFHRSIRVYVAQAISGWEMGKCRIPSGSVSTEEVYFADDEIIDMPLHINTDDDPRDQKIDIFISGDPTFLREVSMEESRYMFSGMDKYQKVMDVFDNGIVFDQPKSLISDEESVEKKIQWYKDTIKDQKPALVFKPKEDTHVSEALPAVQLEFFVGADGKGYVRITNNCTVRGYTVGSASTQTWDYKVQPGSDATRFETYPIYGYHYIPENAEGEGDRFIRSIESIQITADYGIIQAPPCGMIYVDGHVIIGGDRDFEDDAKVAILNTVQGKVAVIASGNIWMANAVAVSDRDDAGNAYPRQKNGMPAMDNPNVLALFAGGVIKVVDPGMAADFADDGHWERVGGRRIWVEGGMPEYNGLEYDAIGIRDGGGDLWDRHLPDPMVVEAAMTIGGGGWGAEHVLRGSNGGRKEASPPTDDLVVRGTIAEVMRGVVGVIDKDGYSKNYYFDERLLTGLIPSAVRLKGKFVTTPGGWSDYRVDAKPQKN